MMDDILYHLAPVFVLLVVLFFFVSLIKAVSGDASALKHQAIERGYALHCPHDGEFAWVGECEGEE